MGGSPTRRSVLTAARHGAFAAPDGGPVELTRGPRPVSPRHPGPPRHWRRAVVHARAGVASHESRVTSHESRVTSHESRVTSHEMGGGAHSLGQTSDSRPPRLATVAT